MQPHPLPTPPSSSPPKAFVRQPRSRITSLDHFLSIAQTARTSRGRASVLFDSIQPAEVYDLLAAREAELERLHIRVFYNSRHSVVQFAEMPTTIHNVSVGWMAIVSKKMVKAGFVLERHLVSSGETSSEGSGDEDQLQGERKNFLITTADYELSDFDSGWNDAVISPDYVIIDSSCSTPSLCIEVGCSQTYARNTTHTGLLDRVDMLLRGTSGRIRAVIVVNIDEDQSKLEFHERFSGFLELWRYRNVVGEVYRDGHRVTLFDPNGGIKVVQKDVYGEAEEDERR
ncbi:hypothetical protein K440DRAFT_246115 [Wilcoxina mikolae CBS 423.85]|nr:hypothetical protein K440DRAFT_246115 [Wilcoxina mikolae CBS 423.85]